MVTQHHVVRYPMRSSLCVSCRKPTTYTTNTLRTDIYYMAFPHDPLVCKCLVYGVFLVELAQTILLMHDAFLAFGSGFGNMEALTAIHLSWLGVPILGGIGVWSTAFRPDELEY